MGFLIRRKLQTDQFLALVVNLYRNCTSAIQHSSHGHELQRTHQRWSGSLKDGCCLLLGNGPSLNELSLSDLRDYTTFAANFFIDHPDAHYVQPAFYCIIDPKISNGTWDIHLIDRILDAFPDTNLFLDVRWRKNARFVNYLNVDRIWWVLPTHMPHYYCRPKYRLDKGILGLNVVAAMLSISTAMGAKNIGLAGVDGDGLFRQIINESSHAFTICKDASLDSFSTMVESIASASQMLWAWRGISLQHESHGIELFNVCKGGIMDCFHRKELSEFLSVSVRGYESRQC